MYLYEYKSKEGEVFKYTCFKFGRKEGVLIFQELGPGRRYGQRRAEALAKGRERLLVISWRWH